MDRITSGGFDVVVLQEQSLRPVQAPEKTLEFGKKLHQAIEAQGARTVLFLTWAREAKPEMQEGLNKTYSALGKAIGADVAPVGKAWARARKQRPELRLHSKDGSHPDQPGAYLSACVFYGYFARKSPQGLPHSIDAEGADRGATPLISVDKEVAGFLQQVAHDVLKQEGTID